MKKRIRDLSAVLALLAALALAALALTAPASAAPYADEPLRTAPVMLAPQSEGAHVKYMDGSDGWFHPEQGVTRAELAQMLYGIVADRPPTRPAFSDVPKDAWYAPAVETAAGLGLMLDDDGVFRPGDPATRAECAYALSQLLPYDTPLADPFSDVWPGYWAYQAICRTAARGLFLGDSAGCFHPDDSLRRCEAVAVFNRLLGRSPDLSYLQAHGGLRTFPDVPQSHWAYGEIMEATVDHQCAPAPGGGEVWLSAVAEPTIIPAQPSTANAAGLADGPQRIDGHLYWVVGGAFARSQSISGLSFNENGWYTTGDEELDETLNSLVDQLTTPSMARDEKLRALFNYLRDNFTYLKRPLISQGQTGWEPEYAKYFLQNGKGNCYNFSAAYCLLCRELGLPAYVATGSVLNSPHAWVEIVLDGEVYMFDTQLEWRYLHYYGKTGYDLFKMSPSNTPFKYTWS